MTDYLAAPFLTAFHRLSSASQPLDGKAYALLHAADSFCQVPELVFGIDSNLRVHVAYADSLGDIR